MRGTVVDGKVLKDSRDRGVGMLRGARDFNPDSNLEDITSTPQFFLDRLKFRVETDLYRQQVEGADVGPGDREVTRAAAQRLPPTRNGGWAMFLDLGKDYGQWMRPYGTEGRRALELMAERFPLGIIPSTEAVLLVNRQTTTFMCYSHSIVEIRGLESEGRAKKAQGKQAMKETANAMAKLTIVPKPLKGSISDVMVQAMEQKVASEDDLVLLRCPVVLNQAVNMTDYSRPELVPDDRGLMSSAVKIIVTWDYITRLIHMLDGLEDKLKWPLIMQELSNTCHLEYRRAQGAYRRQMSLTPGVASTSFRRITTGEESKLAIKHLSSGFTVSSPQLHYILRLCHADTNHTGAAQWIQKLDDRNTRH
ncbi:hypothetical protein LTR56_020447 [Elasticomyces elasticus]|nr:hypothetical protein LTR56_020447 [Elasticomyces elasticus]KAK3645817.1 hypothetical protein LTR22_014585 [Elasticomyces elasticus]KAK4910573.1 hypothetical protein LTR49_020777 [Elasticomyces elasticus]KAK5747297.1 hypothetical protein LTS12_022447 [Elasticomyces elasticus]